MAKLTATMRKNGRKAAKKTAARAAAATRPQSRLTNPQLFAVNLSPMAKVVCPKCDRSLSVALWGLSERREIGEAKRRLRATCMKAGACEFYKPTQIAEIKLPEPAR